MLKDHGSKNDREPLTPKELKEAMSGTYRQTKLKLKSLKAKKGFQAAPLMYTVLLTNQLTPEDRKVVNKVLLKCLVPDQCREVAVKEPGWRYLDISNVSDYKCGLLQYKGLSVSLFFRRQVTQIMPDPKDPVPSGVIDTPADAWVRLDLFTKSPRQLQKELIDKDVEIIQLQQELAAYRALVKKPVQEQKLTDTQVELAKKSNNNGLKEIKNGNKEKGNKESQGKGRKGSTA